MVALTGPSGSGKTTLLSLLVGWQEPTAGSIEQVDPGPVAWVFQNPAGVARRTALDHVVLPLMAGGLRRSPAEVEALAIMDRFNLLPLADQAYATLSGGEAQRLMLARAVAKRAALLLVDEPTAQLDPLAAGQVNSTLRALASRDAIVVVATHDPATMNACQRRIDVASHVPAH
jgi:ABC-type lipoprotein export system ATPase subunit